MASSGDSNTVRGPTPQHHQQLLVHTPQQQQQQPHSQLQTPSNQYIQQHLQHLIETEQLPGGHSYHQHIHHHPSPQHPPHQQPPPLQPQQQQHQPPHHSGHQQQQPPPSHQQQQAQGQQQQQQHPSLPSSSSPSVSMCGAAVQSPDHMSSLMAKLWFDHNVEMSLSSLKKDEHEKRMKELRKELDYISDTNWRYAPIEKYIGQQ
ncbi:uncharacterized protein LOC143019591 [Oratosquilla oratoria]|uniref:uncharacterized protein LOC143019591 n=1 Tax=Oratosquilla oratoria TaxID=337810 RepID=UPI003F773975